MQTNKTWLSISLFCAKENWSKLLQDGIQPFLDVQFAGDLHGNYLLELNDTGGENIRFSIEVPEILAELTAKRADEHFKRFFSNVQFEEKPLHLPIADFFIPYPQNSIQYGLYRSFELVDPMDPGAIYFEISLSQVMMDALKEEEEPEDEALITLAFYVIMALIRCMLEKEIVSVENLHAFFNNSYNRDVSLDDADFIDEGFEDTRNMLLEIADSIFNFRESDNATGSWLGKWLITCRDVVDKKNVSTLFRLVYKHLGVTEKSGLLLSFYIRLVLLSKIPGYTKPDYHE